MSETAEQSSTPYPKDVCCVCGGEAKKNDPKGALSRARDGRGGWDEETYHTNRCTHLLDIATKESGLSPYMDADRARIVRIARLAYDIEMRESCAPYPKDVCCVCGRGDVEGQKLNRAEAPDHICCSPNMWWHETYHTSCGYLLNNATYQTVGSSGSVEIDSVRSKVITLARKAYEEKHGKAQPSQPPEIRPCRLCGRPTNAEGDHRRCGVCGHTQDHPPKAKRSDPYAEHQRTEAQKTGYADWSSNQARAMALRIEGEDAERFRPLRTAAEARRAHARIKPILTEDIH